MGTEKAYWGIAAALAAVIIYVGAMFYQPLLTGFHVLVCVLIMLVVLLQSGRAADLAGAFGGAGSQTAFGPRGAATFLSKATTFLAVVFMVTSLALAVFARGGPTRSLAEEAGQTTTEESAPASEPAQEGAEQPAPPEQAPPAEQPPPPQE